MHSENVNYNSRSIRFKTFGIIPNDSGETFLPLPSLLAKIAVEKTDVKEELLNSLAPHLG